MALLRLGRSLATRTYSSSAREILKQGFDRIESDKDYKKSATDLAELVAAGRELGVPKNLIEQTYESVQPGAHAVDKLTPAQKRLVNAADMAMFETPTAAEFNRPFQYDDLPSAGHLQLEEHREIRSFVRAASYDLPQLSAFASEYRRPDKRERNLQFKHYAFVGEDHPAARKVVMTFRPSSTGLKDGHLHKLKLLAGPRYDPRKEEIKISCDKFPEQAQNKRYLGQLYTRLVSSAKEGDTFEDVPLNLRAAERREARRKSLYPNFAFPEAWNRPDLAPKAKTDAVSVISKAFRS